MAIEDRHSEITTPIFEKEVVLTQEGQTHFGNLVDEFDGLYEEGDVVGLHGILDEMESVIQQFKNPN